nr:transposase [Sphingomonas sp. IC-56]
MVVADGVTGLPVGFIGSIKAADVRAWTHTHLDIDQVNVVVADLHKTNTSIARTKFPNAIYVADKWHVIQRFQRVLSQVINKEINDLRAAGESERAKTIYDFKPGLMAVKKSLRRTRRTSKGGRHTLSFYDDLRPILAASPKIRRAYWARHDFLRFYSSRSLQDAMPWLERFRRHTHAFASMTKMIEFDKHFASNWNLIANYFETVTLRSDGRWRGYTTNALEQYNGQIRKHLRARNGVRNFDLMRLIAVYGSRRIGEEIQLCSSADCVAAIGPVFGPPAPPEIRERTGTYWTCPDCR